MRNKGTQIPRLCALLTLCALLLGLLPQTAGAANVRFITDIRLAAGESGPDSLEAEGYSVMSLGLNAGAAGDEQVWLGFKLGEEAPVTNVLVIADAGEAYESPDGLRYVRAGAVDVEQGRGSAGCVYYTTDERAGAPLVGLDILRADEGEELLAIPNDGSEVVRYPDGAPAELEPGSETVSMYLAQIRDGLVKPYISELTTVTDADRRSAVYTAAAWGYDYFIDGDVDGSRETYTIIAYKRTADPAQAITNLAAVAAGTVEALEAEQLSAPVEEEPVEVPEPVEEVLPEETPLEETEAPEEAPEETAPEEPPMRSPEEESAPEEPIEEDTEEPVEEPAEAPVEEAEAPAPEEAPLPEPEPEPEPEEPEVQEAPVLTGEAVDISGIEYVRVSSRPVAGDTPWYLYITRSLEAGNPISMLYAEADPESSQTLFGMWAYGFFSAKGASRAASYVVNEDALAALQDDQTVCVKLPVALLSGLSGEEAATLPLSLLTAKEGLPEERLVLAGLRERSVEPPVVEHTQTEGQDESLTSTVFGGRGLALLLGGAALLAGVISLIVIQFIRKKHARCGTPEVKWRERQ